MSRINAVDRIPRQTLSPITIKKFKGHVKVQLYNAETDELEQEIEGENMVTNAVAKIFASNYYGTLLYPQLMPISKHMYGGLLCFEQQNTENADNMYVPSNNRIIAHAGQSNTTYTPENDSTRGTYNGVESGEITGGYRHVWDFVSSQGNGTISSLSLTHKDFGDYGFKSNYTIDGSTANYFAPFEGFLYSNQNNVYVGKTGGNCSPVFFSDIDRVGYKLIATGTTGLRIWELKSNGIKDDIGLNQQPPLNETDTTLSSISHDFTMPYNSWNMRFLLSKISASDYDDTATYSSGDKCYHDGKLYKANQNIAVAEAFDEDHWDRQICYDLHAIYPSGTTITRRIINLTDWTMTTSNMTVQGVDMLPPNHNDNVGDCYPVLLDQNDYLYVVGNDSKIHKIKYSNPVDVTNINYTFTVGSVSDRVYQLRNSLHGIGNIGVSMAAGLIIVGNTAYECKQGGDNGDFNWTWNSFAHIRFTQMDNQLVLYAPAMTPTQSGSGIASVVNKMYLGTIFNLTQPIPKAATQTMKITYEITEVED